MLFGEVSSRIDTSTIGENVSVLGSSSTVVTGESVPSSTTLIDSFEDQNFDEYQHEADGGKTPYVFDSGNAIDGTYAAHLDDTGFPKVISTPTGSGDLNAYPGQGDRFVIWMYNSIGATSASNMHFGAYFAVDSSDPTNECYYIRNRVDQGFVRIDKASSSGDTSFANVNVDLSAGWNKIIVEWDDGSTFGGSQGDMTLFVEDDTGTQLGSATGNDTEFAGSAGTTAGFGLWGGNESGEYSMWDYAHITNR